MMRVIRFVLGNILIFLNTIFSPRSMERSPELQKQVDQATQSLKLYHFPGCPFCLKVRRQIKRLGLKIELKDAQNDENVKQELLAGGKELQTPCLRIEESGKVTWMYESSDINAYLNKRFA